MGNRSEKAQEPQFAQSGLSEVQETLVLEGLLTMERERQYKEEQLHSQGMLELQEKLLRTQNERDMANDRLHETHEMFLHSLREHNRAETRLQEVEEKLGDSHAEWSSAAESLQQALLKRQHEWVVSKEVQQVIQKKLLESDDPCDEEKAKELVREGLRLGAEDHAAHCNRLWEVWSRVLRDCPCSVWIDPSWNQLGTSSELTTVHRTADT